MKKVLSLFMCICIVFSLLSCFSITASAQDNADIILYASPNGSDTGEGTLASPLSIIGAKELLKQSKEKGASAVVYLLGGTYEFDGTLVFDSTDMPNVTYKAYNQEVEFSGARAISGFTEGEVNGVKAFIKKLDTTNANWYFKSLFSDENTLSVTRYPEEGYFTVKGTVPEEDLWTPETAIWEFCLGQKSFLYDKNEVSADFKNPGDVNVRILHYWHDELAGISAIDKESGKLTMSRPSAMTIRDIDRFYFENVFEALDEAGEYYIDRADGVLYYIPFENESAETLTLYGSNVDKLISINGVNGISFEGVRFTRTDWVYPEADGLYEGIWYTEYDIDFPQAAMFVDGVVSVAYAENIHFENCEFTYLGGTAIKFLNGVKNSSVENSYFYEIAATAIYAGGTNCYPGDKDYTSNITIKNNEIYKYGRKFFCGIGVHIAYCDTVDIVNNEIHDGYYTGVSVGWTWGYAYHVTKNVTIHRNLIYNIGQGWLSDMGGIYMLGKQPGTSITENVIHNVAADPSEGGYGGWGIYLDEGSSYMQVEKNLVYACGNQSFNIHYGEGNVIRNNIAALSGEGLVSPGIDKGETHATALYYNNIFLTKDYAPVYIEMQTPSHFYDNGNLMWNITKGDELCFSTGKLTYNLKMAEDAGFLHFVTVADPLFNDAENFDFTLSEDSPAFALNFEAWDYSLAGTIKDTVIGFSKQGGQTPYNASSEHVPINVSKPSYFDAYVKYLSVAIPLVLLAVWVVLLVMKADKKITLPFLCVLITLPVFWLSYQTYIIWVEVPYYICAAALGALATGLPIVIAIEKGKKRKRVIIYAFIHFILTTGIYLGLAGVMNLILGSDNPPVILTAISAMVVYMSIQSARLIKILKK